MNRRNQKFIQSYGSWALVTGASSGIGAEFARQLAAKGMNVALAARRAEKLNALATEIKRDHGIQTHTIVVDLAETTALDIIQQETAALDVGLLVSNAGAGVPGAFLKRDLADRTRVLQLNVMAMTELAYVFGQQMSQRKRGGILLTSSISAYIGTPYMADYAAAKAYVLALGEGLHTELKPNNVDVTVLLPGPTRTEMVKTDGTDMSDMMPSMMWMEASAVAAAGLRGLGRRRAVVPGALNKFMTTMTRVMPRATASDMFGGMMKEAMDPAIV